MALLRSYPALKALNLHDSGVQGPHVADLTQRLCCEPFVRGALDLAPGESPAPLMQPLPAALPVPPEPSSCSLLHPGAASFAPGLRDRGDVCLQLARCEGTTGVLPARARRPPNTRSCLRFRRVPGNLCKCRVTGIFSGMFPQPPVVCRSGTSSPTSDVFVRNGFRTRALG